jgi:hypothetical protein
VGSPVDELPSGEGAETACLGGSRLGSPNRAGDEEVSLAEAPNGEDTDGVCVGPANSGTIDGVGLYGAPNVGNAGGFCVTPNSVDGLYEPLPNDPGGADGVPFDELPNGEVLIGIDVPPNNPPDGAGFSLETPPNNPPDGAGLSLETPPNNPPDGDGLSLGNPPNNPPDVDRLSLDKPLNDPVDADGLSLDKLPNGQDPSGYFICPSNGVMVPVPGILLRVFDMLCMVDDSGCSAFEAIDFSASLLTISEVRALSCSIERGAISPGFGRIAYCLHIRAPAFKIFSWRRSSSR